MTKYATGRLRARRAVYWGLLGLACGLAASGAMWLCVQQRPTGTGYFDFISGYIRIPVLVLVLPGLVLGTVAGLALRLQGYAKSLQAIAFVGLSVLTFYFVTQIDLHYWFRGLVWSAAQSAGTVAIFPFARRRGFWLTVTAAGASVASLLELTDYVNAGRQFPVLHAIHWSGWFAVYGALFSTVIPISPATNHAVLTESAQIPSARENSQPDARSRAKSLLSHYSRTWRRAELGAISGAVGWGLVWLIIWIDRSPNGHEPFEWFIKEWVDLAVVQIVPGLVYGVTVGAALWRLRLATNRQIVALAAVSILAQNCGFFAAAVIGPLSGVWHVAVGLLVWNTVQTVGTAAVFPFARRPELCIAMVLIGNIITWLPLLTLSISDLGSPVLGAFWMAWYAANTAIIFSALPADDR